MLPTFLPGRFSLRRGHPDDYAVLQRFHYRAGPPATWADVWVVRYYPPRAPARPIAAAVLSWPIPSLRLRDRALNLSPTPTAEKLAFLNAHVRTISRVAVHPQFRALGLASALIRRLCRACPTRYVEALAAMGRAHPLFERCGFQRFDPAQPDRPLYFLLDKHNRRAVTWPESPTRHG